jgi:hypothetical protein
VAQREARSELASRDGARLTRRGPSARRVFHRIGALPHSNDSAGLRRRTGVLAEDRGPRSRALVAILAGVTIGTPASQTAAAAPTAPPTETPTVLLYRYRADLPAAPDLASRLAVASLLTPGPAWVTPSPEEIRLSRGEKTAIIVTAIVIGAIVVIAVGVVVLRPHDGLP